MSLGQRIKLARKKAGLTQAELGTHFGITSQAVNQWETNPKKGPQRDKIPKIAKILDVPLDWLSTGAGEPPSHDELVDLINRLSPTQRRRAVRLLEVLASEGDEAA